MRTLTVLLCAALVAFAPRGQAIQPEEAVRILRHVDSLRNPLNSFSIDLELTSYRKDQRETAKYRVSGAGSDKSLVEFLSPASERGKCLLMLRDAMWIYVPDTSRPIRISPLQRLMGEASNGDVARTNYSADYVVESMAEENLEGQPAYLLDLKAKDADLSYSHVKLWVAGKSYQPLQADYYVGSGKVMKRAFFREFGPAGDSRMVTKMEILDMARPDRRTVILYSNLRAKQLSDKMFQPAYLGKW